MGKTLDQYISSCKDKKRKKDAVQLKEKIEDFRDKTGKRKMEENILPDFYEARRSFDQGNYHPERGMARGGQNNEEKKRQLQRYRIMSMAGALTEEDRENRMNLAISMATGEPMVTVAARKELQRYRIRSMADAMTEEDRINRNSLLYAIRTGKPTDKYIRKEKRA